MWRLIRYQCADLAQEDQAAGCVDLAAVAAAFPGMEPAAVAQRTLVTALLLRGAYGGMAFDVQLMTNAARRWWRRFTNLDTTLPTCQQVSDQQLHGAADGAAGAHAADATQNIAKPSPWLAVLDEVSCTKTPTLVVRSVVTDCIAFAVHVDFKAHCVTKRQKFALVTLNVVDGPMARLGLLRLS